MGDLLSPGSIGEDVFEDEAEDGGEQLALRRSGVSGISHFIDDRCSGVPSDMGLLISVLLLLGGVLSPL
jgi:hypothetical protein